MQPDAATIFVNGLALIAFGFVVSVVARLVADASASRASDPMFWTMQVIAWSLVVLGVLAVCVVTTGPLAVLLIPVMIVVAIVVYFQVRRARQNGLLAALAVASERLIPMVPAIEAFADEGTGHFPHRARLLAEDLRQGMTLPHALSLRRGLVPRSAVAMIAVGHDAGAMQAGIRASVVQRRSLMEIGAPLFKQAAYLVGMGAVASTVVIFMMLKIVPAFQFIFDDFGVELPATTRALVSLSHFEGGLFSLLIVGFWCMAGLLFAYLAACYVGIVPAFLPGVMWLRRIDGAQVLDALAIVVERERPVTTGIQRLAELYPKASIRLRLYAALDDVNAGVPWTEALGRRRLLSVGDVVMLESAQRAGNLVWAMRELAESHRRRFGRRMHVVFQLTLPLMVFAFGAAVALFAVGFIQPLVVLVFTLIDRM